MASEIPTRMLNPLFNVILDLYFIIHPFLPMLKHCLGMRCHSKVDLIVQVEQLPLLPLPNLGNKRRTDCNIRALVICGL